MKVFGVTFWVSYPRCIDPGSEGIEEAVFLFPTVLHELNTSEEKDCERELFTSHIVPARSRKTLEGWLKDTVTTVERLTGYIDHQSAKNRTEISLQQVIHYRAKRGLFIPAYNSGPKRKYDAVEELADQINCCEIKKVKSNGESPDMEMNVDQSM